MSHGVVGAKLPQLLQLPAARDVVQTLHIAYKAVNNKDIAVNTKDTLHKFLIMYCFTCGLLSIPYYLVLYMQNGVRARQLGARVQRRRLRGLRRLLGRVGFLALEGLRVHDAYTVS